MASVNEAAACRAAAGQQSGCRRGPVDSAGAFADRAMKLPPASRIQTMSQADLAATVDAAWEGRESISPATKGEWRDAVEAALEGLDDGSLRVAEPTDAPGGSGWQVHQWLKKAV